LNEGGTRASERARADPRQESIRAGERVVVYRRPESRFLLFGMNRVPRPEFWSTGVCS
jgi:hypothetical protein